MRGHLGVYRAQSLNVTGLSEDAALNTARRQRHEQPSLSRGDTDLEPSHDAPLDPRHQPTVRPTADVVTRYFFEQRRYVTGATVLIDLPGVTLLYPRGVPRHDVFDEASFRRIGRRTPVPRVLSDSRAGYVSVLWWRSWLWHDHSPEHRRRQRITSCRWTWWR